MTTPHRLFRTVTAAAALLVLLMGVPVALVALGRSPLEGSGSLWRQLGDLLTQPVNDHVAFGVLTMAAWVVWALFALSVAAEVSTALGRVPQWRVPAPGLIHLGARQLVLMLVTSLTLASSFGSRAVAAPPLPGGQVAAEPLADTNPAWAEAIVPSPSGRLSLHQARTLDIDAPSTAAGTLTNSVGLGHLEVEAAQRDDDPGATGKRGGAGELAAELWVGSAMAKAKTAHDADPPWTATVDATSVRSEDYVVADRREETRPTGSVTAIRADGYPEDSPSGPEETYPVVTVVGGDTPWGLAVRHLGEGTRWREIWDLNHGVPQADGRAWVIEDLIHIGWHLQLPADAVNVPPPATPPSASAAEAAGDVEDLPAADSLDGNLAPAPGGTPATDDLADPSAAHLEDLPTTDDSGAASSATDVAPGSEDTHPADNHAPGSRSANDTDDPVDGSAGGPTAPDEEPERTRSANADSPRSDDDKKRGPAADATATTAGRTGNETSSRDAGGWASAVGGMAGVTGATVLTSSLALALRQLRRRRAATGSRTRPQRRTARSARTREAITTAADVPLVRWAGQELADLVARIHPGHLDGAAPVAIELSHEDGIEMLWDQPVPEVITPWLATDAGWTWRLRYDPTAPVPENEQCCPLPALLTIGQRHGRQLMIDLEAFGSLAVVGDPERVANFGRAVGVELGVNDDLADAYVSTVGFGIGMDDHLRRVTPTTYPDALGRLRAATSAVDASLQEQNQSTTFEYRASHPDAYLEAVVALVGHDASRGPTDTAELAEVSPPRHGVATVILGDHPQAAATLHIQPDGNARLDPLGVTFEAAGLPAATLTSIDALFADEEADPTTSSDPSADDDPFSTDPDASAHLTATEHNIAPTVGPDVVRTVPDYADRSNADSSTSAGLQATDALQDITPHAAAFAHREDASPADTDVTVGVRNEDARQSSTEDPATSSVARDATVPTDNIQPTGAIEAEADGDELLSSPREVPGNGQTDSVTAIAAEDQAPPAAWRSDDYTTGVTAQVHSNGREGPVEGNSSAETGRLLLRVLGTPSVPDRPGLKRREVELAAFLACHDGSVSASKLYHALWGGRAAPRKTMWNLVAQTRSRLGCFDDGEPVMPATDRRSGTMRLSDRVTSDLALLRAAYENALTQSSAEAIPTLRQALKLIDGEPFSGPGYEWAHEDQLVIEAAALIEQAATHLTDLATHTGQVDIAREAIMYGLRGLPGNEVLFRARMRLEHDLGNTTAVKAAWRDLTTFLEELGTDPAEATITLYTRMIRNG